MIRTLLLILLLAFAFPAHAQQETPEEERSWLLSFVEDRLSGPNRQIRISGIQGVLSSNATIGSITVADNEGVWLRIVNASIVWSRSALLLQQRLQINRLSAERIEVLRAPLPDDSLPAPEAGGFQVPELPIAVNLDELDVPSLVFGEQLFGLAAEISIDGRLRLEDGSLDTALNIQRLDGPGGQLALEAVYANETQQLDLDLALSEPENGVVANLLGIEGRPPVDLTVTGAGPLSGLDVELTLDAADERILTGIAQLREQAEGLQFATDLRGPIASLIPVRFRDFFGEETALTARGLVRDAGGMVLEALQIRSAALALDASAETATDGFLSRLALQAVVADQAGEPVILPVPGGDTTVQRAQLSLSFGESAAQDWSGQLAIDRLVTPDFGAARANLEMGGIAADLQQPDARRITFDIDGAISDIVATRADISEAIGSQIQLAIEGAWDAGSPIRLDNAEIEANGLAIRLAGTIAEYAFDGDLGVRAENIAVFSALAGRELAGTLDLSANGELRPVSGAFDLTVDSSAEELRIDEPAADNLLAGTTTITGRVARGETGLLAQDLRVANEQLELLADGTFASGAADFDYSLSLSDLALVAEQAQGRVQLTGNARGAEGLIALRTDIAIATGALAGKRLNDAAAAFEGTLEDGALDGTFAASAFLDGERVDLSSAIVVADGEQRLTDLSFVAGGARATGQATRRADGLIDASLSVDAADISTAAALALVEASGALNAQIELRAAETRQDASINGTIRNLRAGDTRIGEASFNAAIENLFDVPVIDGSIEARDLVAGGVDVARLDASASRQGQRTDFEARTSLANGTEATARGSLAPESDGFRLGIEEASLTQGALGARLIEPASLLIVGENVTIDAFAIDVQGSRISVQGTVADRLDLDVAIRQVPLSIANLVRPDLELGGTIDGNARVGGTRSEPDIDFTIQADAIRAAALRQAGQSALSIRAQGNTTTDRLNVEAQVTSPEGLRASLRGAVPLGDGALALNIDLAAFPVAALNAVAPGQDLAGTIAGSAAVSGTLAAPQATFDLRGSGLSAAPLREFGIGSVQATAAGRFAEETLTLNSASVSGPQGLSLTANGSVPLSGSGLGINLSGSVPLSLANALLAERGTQISGTVELSGTVSGSLQQPDIRGMFSTQGAQAVDPEANLRLTGINVMGAIAGDSVTIRSASANLGAGGSLSASGTISTNAATGFPADIRIGLNSARYADGELVVATVSGALALTGPLTRDPQLSGQVNVERAEISVPDSFGGGAAAIDVIHRNPPPGVQATLRRARANDGTPVPRSRPSVLRLDVAINAPNRIFIRGRGLDAEVGGQVRLTGPVTNIQPVGGLQLIRGRLAILGQRITFDEGSVTLVGDLDPFIDFVARSSSGDTVVFITVRGRVSELDISFSSQPELPEDEVLARLIFNRGIGELSPLQIAQLAAAAAELAGGGNSSLLGSLRDATGLDDLDIVTDSEGNAAVRAGRYIQENVYLGVEAGAQGNTRGTINLDITEDLKARGAVGTDGDSSIGLFFERDY